MTPEEAKALREPFDPSEIGKLPKVNCRDCTEANKNRRGATCPKHEKKKCPECKNWITEGHIHLDYVGHAAATDRLLQVDPGWSWRPMATDPDTGAPKLGDGGLWILLTVCGVTRPGWGDGANIKEMIGDAIRNAAMRFGVALDLWAKEDLSGAEQEPERTGKPVPTYQPSRTQDVELPPLADAQAAVAGDLPVTARIDPDDIDFTQADVAKMKPPELMNKARRLGIRLEGTLTEMRTQMQEYALP